MENLTDLLIDALISVLVVLVPILATVITRALLQYLNNQKELLAHEGKTTELFLLQELSALIVNTADQTYKDNSAKRAFALSELVRTANEKGINLSYDDASLLIEGTYRSIKKELSVPNGGFIEP